MEYLELDPERKWEYIQRYYKVANQFFGSQEHIVTDEQINSYISRFKERPQPIYRKEIKVREWNFLINPDDTGVQNQYFASDYDDGYWERVQSPHSCHYVPDPVRFGRLDCNLVKTDAVWQGTYDAWYRTSLPIEKLKENETAYLYFESINHISTVWFNDNPVMLDHIGLFPYKIDIGDELHRRNRIYDQTTLAVRARNVVSNHPNLFYNGWQFAYRNPPYTGGERSEDWVDQADAGIAGEVKLMVVNHNHFDDVFLYTREIGEEYAVVVCQVTLRNASRSRFSGKVRVEISPWLPEEGGVVQTMVEPVRTLPMNETTSNIVIEMQKPHLWNTDSPNLYLAHIILEDAAGQPIDDLFETFGVRTIHMVGSSFYLNNQRVVLRGTHDVAVYVDESEICPSDYIIVKDILIQKKLGANCSRWPSDKSIQYRRLVDYCDQLGFMLSWCGYLTIWTPHPDLEMLAARDIKMMMRDLRNCPSLLIWELGDEPLMLEHDYRRFRWNEVIYILVRAEDQSRPIIPGGDYCRDLLELITTKEADSSLDEARANVLADFPVFEQENAVWDYHLVPHGSPVLPILDQIRDAFAGHKPTVLTEFGASGMPDPTKVVDVYGKFRWSPNPLSGQNVTKYANDFYGRQIGPNDWKETQASQALVLNTMIGRMRSHPKEFAAYYLVSLFDAWTFCWGLVDVHGDPKLSYWVAQNCYRPRYISGQYGNTVVSTGDTISIKVSNYAETLKEARLEVKVIDHDDQVKQEHSFVDLEIEGDVAVSEVAQFVLADLNPGLYSVEYYLYDNAGNPVAKSVELFFIESEVKEFSLQS